MGLVDSTSKSFGEKLLLHTTVSFHFRSVQELNLTALGVGVSKFPNFMMMMGPNGANFWSCLPTIIQIQAQYNCKLVRHLKEQNQKAPYAIYVKEDVQKSYNDYIRDRKTQGPIAVLAPGCHNFYTVSETAINQTQANRQKRTPKAKLPFGTLSTDMSTDGDCESQTWEIIPFYGSHR
jgi:hypothetical protein